MIRILIVGDQTFLCEVLQSWLDIKKDFQVVGYANNGKIAVEQLEFLQPDIVLMDIEMPEMNGLTATKKICNNFPSIKVIVLSANYDINSLNNAFQAGAQGYLLKTNKTEELANTIRLVYKGYNQIQSGLHKQEFHKNALLNHINSKKSSSELMSQPLSGNNTKSHTRLSKSKIIILLSLLIVLSLYITHNQFSSLSNILDKKDSLIPETKQSKRSILPVETISINPVNSYQKLRIYTGNVLPHRTVELGFERSGKITQLLVDEGELVKAFEPLAYLNSSELDVSRQKLLAEKGQAIAQLKEMKAGFQAETIASTKASYEDLKEQLKLASKKKQRRKRLYDEGAISREQLDEAISKQLILQARLNKVKSQLNKLLAGTRPEKIEAQKYLIKQITASLDELKIQRDKNTLRAPFTAIISNRLVDKGTVISAHQPVLRLVDNKNAKIHIGVPVAVANKLSLGSYQQLQIRQNTYKAKITSFLPELDNFNRNVTVVLNLDSSDKVFPGDIAKLKLKTKVSTIGYWLPITSIIKGANGLLFCYALKERPEEKPEISKHYKIFSIQKREIEILHTESDRVLVRGTLQPDDRILSDGVHRIASKQLVRPIDLSEK